MLIDGLKLTTTGVIKNSSLEHVTTLPSTELYDGREVILTAQDGSNAPGPYTYIGSSWIQLVSMAYLLTALNELAHSATTLAGYGITDAYTKTFIDNALASVVVDAYTKSQADTLLADKADKSATLAGYGILDAYTKAQVDTIAANAGSAYTKTEVDTMFSDLVGMAPTTLDTIHELAAQMLVDESGVAALTTVISGKADRATTLAGYGITNAYTKAQVDSAISGNTYSLPTASASVLGGVKVDGSTITITNGVISAANPTTVEAVTTWTGLPYDLSTSVGGQPAGGATVCMFRVGRPMTLAANFAGSAAGSSVAATASTVFKVYKNGTQIGSFTFAASALTATFSNQAAVSFDAGDVITVVAPDTADTTLVNLSFTFACTLN